MVSSAKKTGILTNIPGYGPTVFVCTTFETKLVQILIKHCTFSVQIE